MTKARLHRSLCVRVYALLLLAALAAAMVATITWIDQQRRYHELTSQSREELARLSAMVEQGPMLEQQLTDLDGQLSKTGYFLKAASPALASADLSERLKLNLSKQSAELLEVKFLPTLPKENILRIGVRVHIQGDEKALLQLLYRHEQAQPLLFVKNLTVRALNSSRRGSASETARKLDIHFDLIGYMLRQ